MFTRTGVVEQGAQFAERPRGRFAMKHWLCLALLCWVLACLLLSIPQPVGLNCPGHLVASKLWLDRDREAALDSPRAWFVRSMAFDPARPGPLACPIFARKLTGSIGPPGQETHGPPESMGPRRVAGQSRHLKAPRATFSAKLSAPTTEV
jgi:hypothetical protein